MNKTSLINEGTLVGTILLVVSVFFICLGLAFFYGYQTGYFATSQAYCHNQGMWVDEFSKIPNFTCSTPKYTDTGTRSFNGTMLN